MINSICLVMIQGAIGCKLKVTMQGAIPLKSYSWLESDLRSKAKLGNYLVNAFISSYLIKSGAFLKCGLINMFSIVQVTYMPVNCLFKTARN